MASKAKRRSSLKASRPSASRLTRSSDPPGYWFEGQFREGFPDDTRLTRGQRLRIAGWGRAATPNQLSEEQRKMLDDFGSRSAPARERAERLADFREGPYWRALTAGQQALVDDPSAHRGLRGATYPLRTSQLATLAGASIDQIRQWDEAGLLPARRTPGGQRRFYAASAVRALFLTAVDQQSLGILRKVTAGGGQRLLLGISGVFREQATAASEAERPILLRAAADLEELGLLRAS